MSDFDAIINLLINIWHIRNDGRITDQGGYILSHSEKDQMLEKINQFYLQYSDEDIEQANNTPRKSYKTDRPIKKSGYIYLFKDINHSQHYKIGMSINPKNRLKQVGNVTLIHFFPADDMPKAESELHGLFSNQRTNGEWFMLYEPNLEYIQSIREYKNSEFIIKENDL